MNRNKLNCPECGKLITFEDVLFDNWPDNEENNYLYGWCYVCSKCCCSFEVWGKQTNKNVVKDFKAAVKEYNADIVSRTSAIATNKVIK